MKARKLGRGLAALMTVNTAVWLINATVGDRDTSAWLATAASFLALAFLVVALIADRPRPDQQQ